MSIFGSIFKSTWQSVPDGRYRLRRNRVIIEKALSSGIETSRSHSEQGQYFEADVMVKFLLSDERPMGSMKEDAVIDVEKSGSGHWQSFRIARRRESGGVVTLVLETPYE